MLNSIKRNPSLETSAVLAVCRWWVAMNERWNDLTLGGTWRLTSISASRMTFVPRLLLPSPLEMEDELSDAVARFVLEAGGLKQGVCSTV